MLKKHWAIVAVSTIALFARTIMIRLDVSPWWDPAIYVGMGKNLFSSGTIGMWETLRPPLWPAMLGSLWAIGLDPLLLAKCLAAGFGIATIILLYVIGEKIEKGVGLASAIMLALSPVFTFFVAIPTNDIPGVFLSLLSAYFLLRRKYLISGIILGIAMLMRFPNGLFLLPFGIFILIFEISNSGWKQGIVQSIKKGMMLGAGFGIIAIPYFILNAIIFGDPLLPLKLGGQIIATSLPVESFFYYAITMIADSPAIAFSAVGFFAMFFIAIRAKKLPNEILVLSFLCAIVIGLYYSRIPHKELRYAFAFLPYLAILSAYGLSAIWNATKPPYRQYLAYAIIALVFVSGSANIYYQSTRQYNIGLAESRKVYYETIPPYAKTITSSPQIMLGSDAKIVQVFSSWEYGIDLLKNGNIPFSYAALDSCQIGCSEASCESLKQEFKSAISASSTIIYKGIDDQKCELEVYRMN